MHANQYNSKITIQTERVDNSKQHMTEWSLVKKTPLNLLVFGYTTHIHTSFILLKNLNSVKTNQTRNQRLCLKLSFKHTYTSLHWRRFLNITRMVLILIQKLNRTEQNRTEQNRTEQNSTEQKRTKQNRIEQKLY